MRSRLGCLQCYILNSVVKPRIGAHLLPAIYFCFPYKGVGGVSLLFLRLAEHLAGKGLADCYIVDYADGFMAKNRSEPRLKIIYYDPDFKSVYIPESAIAVFQSMTPWSIYPGLKFHPSARIFYWNCYPFNLVPLLPGFRKRMQGSEVFARQVLNTVLRAYLFKVRRMINLMVLKKALIFMDRPNLEVTERFLGVKIKIPKFIPIPLASSKICLLSKSKKVFAKDGMRVAWVGRLVEFKFHTLYRFLLELNRIQLTLGVTLEVVIIGDGDFMCDLIALSSGMPNLNFSFIDHISPSMMEEYLANNVDMLVAMGTSALEGARLGLPTLLLDVAHAPVSSNYKFQWLHERNGFTLGDVVNSRSFDEKGNSLERKMFEVLLHYQEVSKKSLDYFKKNHELSCVAKAFLRAVYRSDCRYSEFVSAKIVRRGILYTAFSVLRKGLGFT